MRKLVLIIAALVCAGNGLAWAATTRSSNAYDMALHYKKKGLWQQALPLMRRLAEQGHVAAKTDLAKMLLPMRLRTGDEQLTRMAYTDEQAALGLLDEAVASGYAPAMVISADWHADHAAYRCGAEPCQSVHLTQARHLHLRAAQLGEHQSLAWLAYFYGAFCNDKTGRADELRRRAIAIFRQKRPRANAQLAGHWFKTYGAFTGHLQRISLQDADPLCR